MRDETARTLRPEYATIIEQHIVELRARDFPSRIPRVGAPAPAFRLRDERNTCVTLQELLQAGPLVVVFFPGSWCPFCNAELSALADAYARLVSQRARLVAISPQLAPHSRILSARLGLPFPILEDRGNAVAEQYALTYVCPEDVGRYNGDASWRLPVPAQFVIDVDGRIAAAHADPDHRYRPEPDATIEFVAALRGGCTSAC